MSNNVIQLGQTEFTIHLDAQRLLEICLLIPHEDKKDYVIKRIKTIDFEDTHGGVGPCAVMLLEDCIENIGEIHKVTEELKKFLRTLKGFVGFQTPKENEKIEAM